MEKDIPAKLHLLTLTPFYPHRGNEVSGCFVSEPLKELQAQGVMSSVIGVDSIYHPRRRAIQDFPAQWIRYPRVPWNCGLSSAGRFLGSVILDRVRKLHRNSPIQVIHAHAALPCGHAAAFLSRSLGVPFVVTIHGLDVFNSCFQRGIAAGWRRKTSCNIYRSASKVICISEKVQRLLMDGLAAPVDAEVVYNGADTNVFAPSTSASGVEPSARPAILVVGNLLRVKGHELVLRAISRLLRSFPGLSCSIIGEGPDRERLAALARDLGISDRIHFVGRRNRTEVAEAMRDSTVFVLPSRYEGLGCVYLEAMACGKPVIACKGQGIDEIIHHGENGWLISVDDLNEMVQGLVVLLGDSQLRARIGEGARQTILSNFTLSHQAQNLLKIYQEASQGLRFRADE